MYARMKLPTRVIMGVKVLADPSSTQILIVLSREAVTMPTSQAKHPRTCIQGVDGNASVRSQIRAGRGLTSSSWALSSAKR